MLRATYGRSASVCLFVIAVVFSTHDGAKAAVVNVLTLDSSRNFGGRDEAFTSGSLYSGLSDDLKSNANFGQSGAFPQSVVYSTAVSTFTASNLQGANVIIWSQRSQFLNDTEKTAVKNFLAAGGGLMVVSDAANYFASELLGVTSSFGGGLQGIIGGKYPAGTPANITGAPLRSIDPTALTTIGASYAFDSGNAFMLNNYGDRMGIYGNYGLGKIAIWGDDDILMSDASFGARYGQVAINQTAARNVFTFVSTSDVAAVPETSSLALFVVVGVWPLMRGIRQRRPR